MPSSGSGTSSVVPEGALMAMTVSCAKEAIPRMSSCVMKACCELSASSASCRSDCCIVAIALSRKPSCSPAVLI
eukprot:scaffold104673_cov57-Phaeocystis_antarctica.AAC.3